MPNLSIFEPCLWVFTCMQTMSPNRAVFEPKMCPFRAQLVLFSASPGRASFEPEKVFFRAQIVPISSLNRASFEPCSCCCRALSYCVYYENSWDLLERFLCNFVAIKLLPTLHSVWVYIEGRLESRRNVNILGTQQKLEDVAPLFLMAQNFVCVFLKKRHTTVYNLQSCG